MKLLIYDWASYYRYDIYAILHNMGIEYDVFEYDFDIEGRSKHYDEEFINVFKNNYSSNDYDAIFSIAYWAVFSDAAMITGMKYISWSYDCPLDTEKPMRTLNNPCNFVFLFDKTQVDYYKSLGIETVYYMPLGINVERYTAYNESDNRSDRFRTDVSFVGSLYIGSINGIKSVVSDRTRTVMEQIVETQKRLPGQYILDKIITDEFINMLNKEIEEINPGIKGNLSRPNTANTFAYEVTSYNRMMLLMLLGKRYKTTLYTNSKIDVLNNVIVKKSINYYDEMPWCFAGTKINLNSTFISIQTGLPLRVLDIMGCGGFLLSNRQAEFETLGYIDGEDVALFTDFGEAIEKAEYYINNDDVRRRVARNGRKKVYENANMKDKLSKILLISGLK